MFQPLLTAGRALVVLFFLVGMPLLAIPGVLEWLRGDPVERRLRVLHDLPPAATGTESALVEKVSTAVFLQPEQTPEITSSASTSTSTSTSKELEQLAAEIQALGATFYRLERVSDAPDAAYRFTAQFLGGGTPPRRMNLEATAADPQVAMRDVLMAARRREAR
jgi:hypothetical protein